MQPLVSTEWLANAMENPEASRDLIIFDATMYLPNENRIGREEFLRAHIPGARFFDINAIADDETDLPHMLPTPGRFSRLIGQLGVSNESRIVFYDQKGLSSAARGWWMMGVFGHDQAAVLDGGLPKWHAEGRPLEVGEPPPP
ncbi:MAG TPA: rhodanese-like domain-containing protein, partial [Acetobacteraceae bacterium]|nr:rhodanese-like domain-containing protein [Acetobacteraceae bacterium]